MHAVKPKSDSTHQHPVQENADISLQKPLVFALSIIGSMVAYAKLSPKVRKTAAVVILTSGASYSFGLCSILKKVSSVFGDD